MAGRTDHPPSSRTAWNAKHFSPQLRSSTMAPPALVLGPSQAHALRTVRPAALPSASDTWFARW